MRLAWKTGKRKLEGESAGKGVFLVSHRRLETIRLLFEEEGSQLKYPALDILLLMKIMCPMLRCPSDTANAYGTMRDIMIVTMQM